MSLKRALLHRNWLRDRLGDDPDEMMKVGASFGRGQAAIELGLRTAGPRIAKPSCAVVWYGGTYSHRS